MEPYEKDAQALIRQIDLLREPYRQNTIAWLESCTQQPMEDLQEDIMTFLRGLNPIVRDNFLFHTRRILDDAVRYFGVDQPNPRRGGVSGLGGARRMRPRNAGATA